MNVTSWILDVYVIRFDITHKNFPVDETKSCTIIASIFFWKIYMDSEKSINLFEMKKKA